MRRLKFKKVIHGWMLGAGIFLAIGYIGWFWYAVVTSAHGAVVQFALNLTRP